MATNLAAVGEAPEGAVMLLEASWGAVSGRRELFQVVTQGLAGASLRVTLA
jgi:hypothetical protein